MERPIWFNGRVIVESVGVLGWENDRYVWQLPEEAYTATSLTAAEVADILGLLNWLNSNEV